MSRDPEAQKQYLTKEMKVIKIEARSGVIKNYSSHLSTQPISEEIDAITSMAMWVKSARFF